MFIRVLVHTKLWRSSCVLQSLCAPLHEAQLLSQAGLFDQAAAAGHLNNLWAFGSLTWSCWVAQPQDHDRTVDQSQE